MVVYVCSSFQIGLATSVMEACRATAVNEAAQAALAVAVAEADAANAEFEAAAAATGDEIIYVLVPPLEEAGVFYSSLLLRRLPGQVNV